MTPPIKSPKRLPISEDLKIGDQFRLEINDAIRHHDKLVLVLSASSIESSWVEDEVKKALKREEAEGKTVLFPVRIDDAVLVTPEPWAARIRKHDAYDFTLSFSGIGVLQNSLQGPGQPGTGGAPDPNGALSLPDAVSKQLGLKLELEKRPAPVLVIDHVERQPTEN